MYPFIFIKTVIVHIPQRRIMKRKNDGLKDTDESPVTRIRRSQVIAFGFKSQCLFCAEPSKLFDPKHPDRWDL